MGGVLRYKVEWTTEAWTEVHLLRVFERRAVMRAVDELSRQAEIDTRNRKPLRHPIAELPDATWEVRVRSRYRLLYRIRGPAEGETERRTVEILRAIIKGTETTERSLGKQR